MTTAFMYYHFFPHRPMPRISGATLPRPTARAGYVYFTVALQVSICLPWLAF